MSELTTAIPGGMAQWYETKSLPARRERMMQVKVMPVNHIIRAIQADPEGYPITESEAQALLEVNEVAVAVFLKSWTLKDASGNPIPLPATADEVLDLESRELYDALTKTAAKILVENPIDDFSVDAVEDENSPIGDLGA
jgi:hypothetical protein